jgi:hypothetical protein
MDGFELAKKAVKENLKIQRKCWGIQYVTPSKENGWIDQDGDPYKPDFSLDDWIIFSPEHTSNEIVQKETPVQEVQESTVNSSSEKESIIIPSVSEPVKTESSIAIEPKIEQSPTGLTGGDWTLIGALHILLWATLYFIRR